VSRWMFCRGGGPDWSLPFVRESSFRSSRNIVVSP
jgi:hypothetical protein